MPCRLRGDDLPRQGVHPGVVIASPSLDEFNELYEIRITLEPLASARHMAGLIEKTRGSALGDG
jgi:DNA-binding GntR family transcriptional regulator